MKSKVYFVSLFILFLIVTINFSIYRVSGISMMKSLKSEQILFVQNFNSFDIDIIKNDIIIIKMYDSEIKLVKRCVALPSDTINIKNGFLYINSDIYNLGNNAYIPLDFINDNGYLKMDDYNELGLKNKNFVKEYFISDSMIIFPLYLNEYNIISLLKKDGFTMIIPYKGMKINYKQIDHYKKFIRIFPKDSVFEHDYYFVLGDNFLQSLDSRHYGFVRDDNVLGKEIFKLN